MEKAFGLKIMKNETTEAFTGRSRLVFTRLQSEGANLPSEARGYIVLRGCRRGSLGRATIMSATRRSCEFDDVCMAIQTSFPGCPPDRRSHGWKNLRTRSRTKPTITLSSGMTLCLNPRLRPSWEPRNPWKKVTQTKFLRPGNKPGRPRPKKSSIAAGK